MSLAALGIVFGDIGTSPLYAFRESFLGLANLEVTPGHIYGVLSMIFWSLIIVISIKYLLVVMRADNEGEGGIIALVSLLKPREENRSRTRNVLILMGIFGAALLYGDGTITPAISVLSALEGLEVATDAFDPYIIPMTIGILIGLFSVQKFGTAKIGKIFGPIMLIWFATLGVLGIRGIIMEPSILKALNPVWAGAFLIAEPGTAFVVLGTVFLVVTGGETLYADMGHFGRKPITLAWFVLVLPCLMLNYMGQGGLVLADSQEIQHPFFHLAPDWALYPMVILATIATVIASQAVISGVFSLTRQAMQLGQLPRMQVIQTHGEEFGQIYIPVINWMLMIATIGLVLGFQSSGNLASAYGLAIAMDMVITTFITLYVLRKMKWNIAILALMAFAFMPLDFSFFIANAVKFIDGGWYPVLVGLLLFGIMTTWNKGKERLRHELNQGEIKAPEFIEWLKKEDPVRTPGTAIFMTSLSEGVPATLIHHVERNRALHERVVLLHVETLARARSRPDERIVIEELGKHFTRIVLNYGFIEPINVPQRLRRCKESGVNIDVNNDATYFLGRETLVTGLRPKGMSKLRSALFSFLSRNAGRATTFYRIPREQVVELGLQVEV